MYKDSALKGQSKRVIDYFGVRPASGEVGIEIEAIGVNLPAALRNTKSWVPHRDESVRPRAGEIALEYSLAQPVGRDKVAQVLGELLEEFRLAEAVAAEDRVSNSVHVHLNAQQLTLQQVYTWLTVYLILEDLLVEYAGPERRGNLFCLRSSDAKFLIRSLCEAARTDRFNVLSNDNLRYSAANVVALGKFGSVEFRALRGTVNDNVIRTWVKMLLAVKDAGAGYKDPVEVVADFSKRGPQGFIEHVFPKDLQSIFFGMRDYDRRMFDGLHLAQDVAFSTKWLSVVAPKDEKPVKKGAVFDDFDNPVRPAAGVFDRFVIGAAPPPRPAPRPWNAPTAAQIERSITRLYVGVRRPDSLIIWRWARGDLNEEVHEMRLAPAVQELCRRERWCVDWHNDADGNLRLAFRSAVTGERIDWVRWGNVQIGGQ